MIRVTNAESINRIILDNSGVDDEEFSNILRGAQKLLEFKKVIYKRNVFLEKSLREMLPLLQKVQPNHLEELRVENCKTSEEIMTGLARQLNERCFLKKLGLVNVKINDESFDILCDFVFYSDTLEELDINTSLMLARSRRARLQLLFKLPGPEIMLILVVNGLAVNGALPSSI